MEEVTVHAGSKVLVNVDDNSALIFVDPQGILGLQLRPQPMHLLYNSSWGTRHCPGHYIKVIKCIRQLMQSLFVDEQRNSWMKGKAAR